MAANRQFTSQSSRFSVQEQLRGLVRGAVVLGLGCGLLGHTAFGQFGSIGQTGMGQTGFGQTGMGQAGMGQMGMGQMGMGQMGMGQLGGMGQMGGMGQGGQAGANGAAANPFGSGGMLGSTNSFGGLAGAALMNRSMQNNMGMGMGMGGMSGMGAMGGRGGRGGMNGMNQNQNSNKPKIRATVKLGFGVASPSSAATSRVINERLTRIPSPALEGVTVVMQGRTAVIRGEVDSPEAGRVVERYLSLEPGIDAVKNELTLANGPDSPVGANDPVMTQPQPSVPSAVPPSSSSSSRSGASAEIVPAPGPSL